MSTRDELVEQLEQVDGAIEVLRTAQREKEAERVQIISALGGRPEAPGAPQPAGETQDVEHTWFGSGGPTQPSDATQVFTRPYVAEMVHRNSIPNHLRPHLRMHEGRYEAHLLPIVTVAALTPAQRPALCGVTSSKGAGSTEWESVQIGSGASHVEVCRDCMTQLVQLEQASRTS